MILKEKLTWVYKFIKTSLEIHKKEGLATMPKKGKYE